MMVKNLGSGICGILMILWGFRQLYLIRKCKRFNKIVIPKINRRIRELNEKARKFGLPEKKEMKEKKHVLCLDTYLLIYSIKMAVIYGIRVAETKPIVCIGNIEKEIKKYYEENNLTEIYKMDSVLIGILKAGRKVCKNKK